MKLHEAKPGHEYINGEYLDVEHMDEDELIRLGVEANERLAQARDDVAILADVYKRRFGNG